LNVSFFYIQYSEYHEYIELGFNTVLVIICIAKQKMEFGNVISDYIYIWPSEQCLYSAMTDSIDGVKSPLVTDAVK